MKNQHLISFIILRNHLKRPLIIVVFIRNPYRTTMIMANCSEDPRATEEPESSPLLENILGSGEVGKPVNTPQERLVISTYLPHYEPEQSINMIPGRLLSMLAYLATLGMYILCIRYEGKCPRHPPRSRWAKSTCRCKKPFADVQIGVSGKKNTRDKSMAGAARRELGEEIGVVPLSGAMSKVVCIENTTTSHNLSCYFMPVSECRSVTEEDAAVAVAPKRSGDDDKKKAWNFVFGSYAEMEAIMKQLTHVLPSNDRCASIVAIPAIQAYTAVRYIMGATGKAPSRPFAPDVLKDLLHEHQLGLESVADPMKFQVGKAKAEAEDQEQSAQGFTLDMLDMPPPDSALALAISSPSPEMAPMVASTS